MKIHNPKESINLKNKFIIGNKLFICFQYLLVFYAFFSFFIFTESFSPSDSEELSASASHSFFFDNFFYLNSFQNYSRHQFQNSAVTKIAQIDRILLNLLNNKFFKCFVLVFWNTFSFNSNIYFFSDFKNYFSLLNAIFP